MFEQRPKKTPFMDMGNFKAINVSAERSNPEKAVLPTKNNLPRRKILKMVAIAMAGCVLLALSGTTIYFYRQWKEIKTSPEVSAQKETDAIIGKIGQFMELPADEKPTLATVTNVEKLKDQPFFTKAQNGDKVLIYPKARKAILYRPSANKIIEASSLSSAEAGTSQSSEASQLSPEQL